MSFKMKSETLSNIDIKEEQDKKSSLDDKN